MNCEQVNFILFVELTGAYKLWACNFVRHFRWVYKQGGLTSEGASNNWNIYKNVSKLAIAAHVDQNKFFIYWSLL